MDLLVSEDDALDAGAKQQHAGHVCAVTDKEHKWVFVFASLARRRLL